MKLEGTTLGGKYRILQQIGAGGMGRVFEAVHEQTERKVAVKVLSAEAAQQPDTLVRFDREARAAGRIGHDNICEVIDVGFADGNIPYLVMPMLRGQSLATALRAVGPLPLKRCLDVTTQILAALAAAHDAGVIHRDLKPDNVFLIRMGDREDFVKVLDFGISKMLNESRPDATLTQTGTILGTPYYMSPEQARGLKDLDARVDVYAMGAILFQMLTGKPPFDGDSYNQLLSSILLDDFPKPSAVRPETPPAVEEVILHATQKDRRLRYRDAGDMRNALLAAVTGTSLKPADLMASSETLPAPSEPSLPVNVSSPGPGSGAPSSPVGPSTAPGLREPTLPVRTSTGSGAAGGDGPDIGSGETAVASALSQSRMGQAVLAETASRPPRSRLVGVLAAVVAIVAIVATAAVLLRWAKSEPNRQEAAGARTAAATTSVASSAASAVSTADVRAAVVEPVPPAAPDAETPAPDARAVVAPLPDAAAAADAAPAPAEIRITLHGVPRGALVLVDHEAYKGTTILRRRGPGEVQIEIQERGYRPWLRTVPLVEDVDLEVRMTPVAARPPRDGGGARDGSNLPGWSEDE